MIKLPIDILRIIMTYNHLCRKHLCSSVKTKTWNSLWINWCVFHGISDHMFTLCFLFLQRRKTKKTIDFHKDGVVHKITETRVLVSYGALWKRCKMCWSCQESTIWLEEIWKCCPCLAPYHVPFLGCINVSIDFLSKVSGINKILIGLRGTTEPISQHSLEIFYKNNIMQSLSVLLQLWNSRAQFEGVRGWLKLD